jgi:ribonuclease BN (tRNA processing enzyme)
MELVVLGVGAAYPGPGQACSGYLVKSGGTNLLIDCGNGVVSRLQQASELEGLTALIFSHLHADHCLDIFSLFYSRAFSKPRSYPPLPIYLPPGEMELFARLSEVLRVEPRRLLDGTFRASEYDPSAGLDLEDLRLSFAQTEHPVPAYSIRSEDESGSIVYSSDTGPTEKLVDLAKGCDLLLSEATLAEEDFNPERPLHLTPRMAAEVAVRAGARRLLLTHIWPHYDRQAMLEDARRIFPAAELAEELERYPILEPPGP